ncbi:Bacteriophage P22, Gp10, DNA-stabilising [uncultured Caudovirales phage]|uniref:Bacteriophage P22, Gp10, DNA-stabilising n=1 Tax=uncultured Caudovirales phage TaxID=2100421 RepID=A0A6J5TAK2_9CAUD|nr:Bacteriophage P22, Gp10, DNA-stabilising [uncultured Caudovirales phage]
MKTPILGSAYVARSVNAADNQMINLFPEVVPEAGKEPAFLQRAPGLNYLASLGAGPVRGLWQFGNYGYAVSGTTLYKLDSSFNAVAKGTVTGTGQVSMVDNGTQLFIAAGATGYIYNAGTDVFAQITDPDFAGAVTVGFIDGYFVYNQPNSQKFWVTSLYDGTSVDPLDFASAEGSPDNLVSLIVDHREIWLFGQSSIEVWYDAGLPDFPLSRIQGAFIEIGCAAPFSVAKLDNGVFWLSSDARGRGMVFRSNGYAGVRISTHSVEWQIQQYADITDAVAYTYQQDGHSFYVLNFPSADITWVYDVATQSWHQRAGWLNNQYTRHRGNCQMAFNGQIVIGDYLTGDIYSYDLNVYTEAGAVQKWLRSWRALPTGTNNLRRSTQHSLQLDCEAGVGLDGAQPATTTYLSSISSDAASAGAISGESEETTSEIIVQGSDPQVMLRWSDDGGHTWSNEHWRSMGKIGETGRRVLWRRLGMTMKLRDRVYEVSGTDPVKIAIMGAELIVSPTNA